MMISPVTTPVNQMDKQHAALHNACAQFESFFLTTLFKEMRKTVPKDPVLGDDANQQDIFQGMMDQKVAETTSNRGDFGLAAVMYQQLSRPLDAATAAKDAAASPHSAVTASGPSAVKQVSDALKTSAKASLDIRR